MDTSNDGDSMEIVDIATEGDLLLVVGTKPAQVVMLRVHSLILKTVSKVFNAMFGPQFSEGQAVDGDQRKEIALPEDHARGMKILCQVMHHKYGDMPDIFDPVLVLRIARIADNYDCSGILEHIRTQWLNLSRYFGDEIPVALDSLELADVSCLLAAAYLLDDETAFKELTQLMILHYARSYLKLAKHEWICDIIPNILYMLEEKRSYLRTRIVEFFSNPYTLGPVNDGQGGKVPVITTKLREVGLTPTEISKCSITNVIILMEEVCSPKYHGKIGRIRYKLRGNDKDQIEDYHREYSSMLRGELSELTSNPALCLDCVLHRTNGNGNTSSQCRIWHKEEDDHLSSTEE